jgi:hypothetical protein
MDISIFFDTEFTQLSPLDGVQKLISIGCCTTGGQEFYAELADSWHPSHCSKFVTNEILPLLQGGDHRMTEAELASRLKAWVETLTSNPSDKVIFRSDCLFVDWFWVENIFNAHGWPVNLRKEGGHIHFNHESQHRRYQQALGAYWKEHAARQHHALIDARSLAVAFKFALRRGI